MISVSEIERRDKNNSILKIYMNNIYLWMLSLANILLNSEPYIEWQASWENLVSRL